MGALKAIPDFLLEFYDKIVLGLLLVAMATVMCLQTCNLRETGKKVQEVNDREEGEMPTKLIDEADPGMFAAKTEAAVERFWGNAHLSPAWGIDARVPSRLSPAAAERLQETAEGSMFDPMLYVLSRKQDGFILHFKTERHPRTGNYQGPIEPRGKAPPSPPGRPTELVLANQSGGDCLTLTWDPEEIQPNETVVGTVCWQTAAGKVHKFTPTFLVEYQGRKISGLSWADQERPGVSGRVDFIKRTGQCSLLLTDGETAISDADFRRGPAVCSCEEGGTRTNGGDGDPIANARLMGVRRRKFPIVLTNLKAPNPDDKRTWVVQVDVFVARRGGATKRYSRWPTLATPAIQGTTYQLVDMEHQEEAIQAPPYLRKVVSITVQNTKDPDEPPIVLRPKVSIDWPGGKADFALVDLKSRKRFVVQKDRVFDLADPDGGQARRYKVVDGDRAGLQVVEVDALGAIIAEPYLVRLLTPAERDSLARKKRKTGRTGSARTPPPPEWE